MIGSDLRALMLTGKMIKLKCGLLATETIFGWTISGPVTAVTSNMATTVTSSLLNMAMDVSHLWSLEAIGIRDPIEVQSKEEEELQALQHFRENVTQDADGRYVVALPWKASHTSLPTNRVVAEKRLQRASQQLLKRDKFEAYNSVFAGWEKEGLIIEVADDKEEGHYLPHRPVFKDSLTTPVRPVYDASCKVGTSPSLNDCLYKAPNLLEMIPSLLLRFRENAIGVSADIRKAFQMIRVREEDPKYQRFLWWTDASCKRIKVFQHRRVVFGLNCSPFLLAATINHHLNSIMNKDLATVMIPSFYVDNLVNSVSTVTAYDNLKMGATTTMKEAGMDLRQWARTLGDESGADSNQGCRLDLAEKGGAEEEETVISVLGLAWNRAADTISCVIPEVESTDKFTKKTILSLVARIFDPIGFLAPAVVPLKNLIQESWASEYGWDEVLPETYQQRVAKWLQNLKFLSQVQLPRMFQFPGAKNREIHVFVDASSIAYAGVVYMRTEVGGRVKVQLLLAKARLAPTKRDKKNEPSPKPTIPRLELMACVIGTRLAAVVQKATDCTNIPFQFWSDSTTALARIRRHDHWGTFVGNRVAEILKTTNSSQWRHVPGILNPADLPSRGCDPHELLESTWWEGPNWLKLDKPAWPGVEEEVDEKSVSLELRKSPVLISVIVQAPHFLSYRKNVAVYAWMLRVFQKNKPSQLVLSIVELRRAEKFLIKAVQREAFPGVLDAVGKLQIFRDQDGVIRVKTRLLNRDDKEDFLSPILLPRSHPMVVAVIRDFHFYNGHGGINFIRKKIREKYWIVDSRRTVRKVIGDCTICKRHASKPIEVDPASLPKKRIADGDPFTTVGVDLAGPLYLKQEKAWIVIYTCAVYRCVHLDMVRSLSTEVFLESLERFIASCGRPNTIFSDNGTNFIGAANLFRQLNWKELEEKCDVKQIQWIFNPPTAAWWGGWWERLIRSVKDLLKRILGKSKLTYDQMRTILAGVSATINDRPLTVITEDNGDLHVLSPSMFIRPLRIGTFPDVECAPGMSERYKLMKSILRQLQERFRKEYLSILIMPLNKNKQQPPAVGDVVLIGSDNRRRFEWPMGVIVELHTSRQDGKVRVAKVKTSTGILERPLQRLYPLEVTRPAEEEFNIPVDGPEPVTVGAEPLIIKTRRGRTIRKPTRYAQWLHSIK